MVLRRMKHAAHFWTVVATHKTTADVSYLNAEITTPRAVTILWGGVFTPLSSLAVYPPSCFLLYPFPSLISNSLSVCMYVYVSVYTFMHLCEYTTNAHAYSDLVVRSLPAKVALDDIPTSVCPFFRMRMDHKTSGGITENNRNCPASS